jgi:hypothetical protein
LDVTRQQFDVFMGALSQAMSEMKTVAQPTSQSAEAPVVATAAPTAAPLAAPVVANSTDIAPDGLAVVLFVDSNANGKFDEGEPAVVGASVALMDAAGKAIADKKSTADGLLFTELTPGKYTVTIEDAAGHKLLTSPEAAVTVAKDAKAGQTVYVPVVAE